MSARSRSEHANGHASFLRFGPAKRSEAVADFRCFPEPAGVGVMGTAESSHIAGPAPVSHALVHLRLARRRPGLRRLVLANLLSTAGSQISRIALILFVYGEHLSVVELAVLVLLETLPGAAVAPIAGVMIDRFSKRQVMIIADLLRAAFMIAVLLAPVVGVVYAMVALHSAVTVIFQPAKEAAIAALVENDELLHANSLDQSTSNLVLVVAPVAGGALYTQVGLEAALLLDIVSFLASALLLVGVPLPPPDQRARLTPRAIVADVQAGVAHLLLHPLARRLALVFFGGLVCTGLWLPVAPFFLAGWIGAPPSALGWQLGILGMGAIVGGLGAPALAERFGRGRLLWAGLLAEGLLQSIYAVTPHLWASHMLVFLWGVSTAVIVVPFYSLLQSEIAAEYHGRVFALLRQAEYTALSLAMALVLMAQTRLDSAQIILGGGLGYVALAVGLALLPRSRTMLHHA